MPFSFSLRTFAIRWLPKILSIAEIAPRAWPLSKLYRAGRLCQRIIGDELSARWSQVAAEPPGPRSSGRMLRELVRDGFHARTWKVAVGFRSCARCRRRVSAGVGKIAASSGPASRRHRLQGIEFEFLFSHRDMRSFECRFDLAHVG